jgi:hypothetical protein
MAFDDSTPKQKIAEFQSDDGRSVSRIYHDPMTHDYLVVLLIDGKLRYQAEPTGKDVAFDQARSLVEQGSQKIEEEISLPSWMEKGGTGVHLKGETPSWVPPWESI